MNGYQDYHDERRDMGWEKFDPNLSGLAVQLIGSEFDSIDRIPNGVRFNQEAYTLKVVEDDQKYLAPEEEKAMVIEYDRNNEAYDSEFVDNFTEAFSNNENVKEKIEENFDVLFR